MTVGRLQHVRPKLLLTLTLMCTVVACAVLPIWEVQRWMDSVSGSVRFMTLFLGIPVWQSDDVSALEAWANANELPLNREWIKVQGDGRNLFGITLVRDHDEAPPIYQVPEIQACMLYLPKENVVLFLEKMNSTDDAVQQAAVEKMCDDMYSATPSASKSEDK